MNVIALAQSDTTAAVDTLTKVYSTEWKGASTIEHSNSLVKTAASHDLIFIVLAVSLVIWFVLLFFIIRLDLKVGSLEQEISNINTESS